MRHGNSPRNEDEVNEVGESLERGFVLWSQLGGSGYKEMACPKAEVAEQP